MVCWFTGALLYGTLNATTLQEGGTNLDAKYATTTSLNAKENTLTFSAPLTRTTNTIQLIYQLIQQQQQIIIII
jgi:hypothetical protein